VLPVWEVRANEEHFGRTVESADVTEILDHADVCTVYYAQAHKKCPICGASPRTAVAFCDPDFEDKVAYCVCPKCNHTERV